MTAGHVAAFLIGAGAFGLIIGYFWWADRRQWNRDFDQHAQSFIGEVVAHCGTQERLRDAEQEAADLSNALVVEQVDHERTRQAWHDAMQADNVLPMYRQATDAHLTPLDGGAS